MKKSTILKYSGALLATLLVIGIYHLVNIRLFYLDIEQVTREHLFKLNSPLYMDESIVILNIGKLDGDQLKEKVDSLLTCSPAAIGINACSLKEGLPQLMNAFWGNKKVVIANCDDSDGSQGRILNEGNTVTHFRRDNPDYFESKIDLLTNSPFHQRKLDERKNDVELINYVGSKQIFQRYELSQIAFLPEFFSGKTILLGYMGDYMTDSLYYHDYCRITPMNEYYGYDQIDPDMYDIEISANIIRQLDNNHFINEISDTPRILILFLICIITVLILSLVKTRWLAVNIIIGFVLFMLVVTGSSMMIVYAFTKDYYLNLDELPLALLVISVFTISLSAFETEELKSLQIRS